MIDKRRTLLLVLAATLFVFSWLPFTTTSAEANIKEGLTRSLAAFGIARALGAGVSVAQSVQVNAGLVVSGTVGVGEVLQPLNELIDKFANVMLLASVSFGIQLVLLKIGTHWLISAFVTFALAWTVLRNWNAAATGNRALHGVLVLMLMVRFAVPVSAIGSDWVYKTFMAHGDSTELAEIQSAAPSLGDLTNGASEAESQKKRGARELLDKGKTILNAASGWTKNIVHLIASFLLQTVLLPLGFLFLTWRAAQSALNLLVSSASTPLVASAR